MKIFLLFVFLMVPYLSLANFEGDVYYTWLKKCVEYKKNDTLPISLGFSFTSNDDVYYKVWNDLYKNHKLFKKDIYRLIGFTSNDTVMVYSIKNKNWKEDVYENDTYKITFDTTLWFYVPHSSEEAKPITLFSDHTYEEIPTRYSLTWKINWKEYEWYWWKNIRLVWSWAYIRKFNSENKKHSLEIISFKRWDQDTAFYLLDGKKSQLYDSVDFANISDLWDYMLTVREWNTFTTVFNGEKITKSEFNDVWKENFEWIQDMNFINNQKVYVKLSGVKKYLIVWEKEFQYDEIYDIIPLPQNKGFYARVTKNNQDIWNINWKEYDTYEKLYYMDVNSQWDYLFSGFKNGKFHLIKNGKILYTYDKILHPQFYNTDKIIFYAENDGKMFYVDNGIEWKHYNLFDYSIESPNFSRYAFVAYDIWNVYCEDISKVIDISVSQREQIEKYFFRLAKMSLQERNKIFKILQEKRELQTDKRKKEILDMFLKNINL